MLEFVTNNELVSALIAAALIAIAGGTWKLWHDRRDSQAIYDFLLASGTSFTFRSTEAISSHTKIPEKRVADLCSKHPKIRRNQRERQSWTLDA